MIRFESALIILGNKTVKVQLCRNVAYILHTRDLVEEISFVELIKFLRNVEMLKHSRNFWKVLQSKIQ